MDISETYIIVPRGIFAPDTFGIPEPYSKREAFLDLVQMASWAERDVTILGFSFHTERGQLVASKHHLASRWIWSEAKVRHFLERLKGEGWIDIGIASRFGKKITLITIIDYDQYQGRTINKSQ